jgi:hypothetical protein
VTLCVRLSSLEVHTAMTVKSTILRDVVPCSLIETPCLLLACTAYSSTLKVEASSVASTRLHGVTSQKILFFDYSCQ